MKRSESGPELTVWYDEHGFSPLTSIGLHRCLTRGMRQTIGDCFSATYDIVQQYDHVWIVTPKAELDGLVDRMVERILEEPDWADGFNADMMAKSEILLDTTRRNAALAHTADDAALASFHEKFVRQVDEKFRYGILPILAESNEGALSRAYYEQVKKRIGEGNFAGVADLLAPDAPSAPTLQHMAMLRLAASPNAQNASTDGRLDALFQHWSWVPYAFVGPAWTMDACRAEFDALRSRPKAQLASELDALENRQEKVETRRQALMDQYSLDEHQRRLTEVIAGFARTKYQRKENFTHAHFHYHAILAEMARRRGLSMRQVRLLTPAETKDALVDSDVPNLKARAHWTGYAHRDGQVQVLNEKEAKTVQNRLPKEAETADSEVLQGQCACPGKASGKAVIVNTEKEVSNIQEGDVLFSYATAPELMAAIRKASAIVTDRGGVTCHAAIVSRELNIPCVIGTRYGTGWVREGQMVEVDATQAIVRKK